MSIPAWRKVEYTDDGCSIYECLNCYKSWEARTSPDWGGWQFCPYCGIGWEQQVVDNEDKTFTRRNAKFSLLDRNADIDLEIKHYQLDDDGKYDCFIDWEYVSYGMSFHDIPIHADSQYDEKLPSLYKDYLYRVKIAKAIKELAEGYSDQNKLCDNFFMFTEGYELRLKITSRITGEINYIELTDGITPVVRNHPYPYPKIKVKKV